MLETKVFKSTSDESQINRKKGAPKDISYPYLVRRIHHIQDNDPLFPTRIADNKRNGSSQSMDAGIAAIDVLLLVKVRADLKEEEK